MFEVVVRPWAVWSPQPIFGPGTSWGLSDLANNLFAGWLLRRGKEYQEYRYSLRERLEVAIAFFNLQLQQGHHLSLSYWIGPDESNDY